jgi:uncharacterized protein (UPF0276 family)
VTLPAGVGLGWRPETAWLIDVRPGLAFTEVIAENVSPDRPPPALAAAVERGLPVIAHGVSLNLGGAEPPERGRILRLAAGARTLRAPLVSEHVAFSRALGASSPHFLPVPHTRAQLAVLVDHVRRVMDALDVPLALENVAAPLAWPGDELAEAELLAELIDRTGALLLLDVANLHANLVNHGGDLDAYLARLPLDRIAYLHAAGGARVGAMWRDTHAHPIGPGLAAVLAAVLARTGPRPILLERDHAFGTRAALEAELDTLEAALAAAPVDTAVRAPSPRTGRGDLVRADEGVRRALAERHHGLIRALLEPGAPPPGFDPVHVEEARAILAAKTAHAAHGPHRH